MTRVHVIALCAGLATFAGAQAPLFQVLDNPVPPSSANIDAVGDLDGDGDADLLGPGGISLNDGHGRFTAVPGTAYATGFRRKRTMLADLNADGLQDIVSIEFHPAASSLLNAVRVDLNAGGLIFTPVAGLPPLFTPAPLIYPSALATGDVDGDGDVDIMIGAEQYTGPSVGTIPTLWLNNGAAVFTTAPVSWLPAIKLGRFIFLRDLDADGDVDGLFAGDEPASSVQVAWNTGTTFVPAPAPLWTGMLLAAIDLGDFDGDALPDIAVSASAIGAGTIGIILNSPSGFTAASNTFAPGGIAVLTAVDLNGDAKDELVAVTHPSLTGASVHTIDPLGFLSAPTQFWPDLSWLPYSGLYVARDLDGDGDRDLIGQADAQPVALMNDGTGALVRLDGRIRGGFPSTPMIAGDLDADGDADILGATLVSVVTRLNDGHGFFTPGPATPIVSHTSGISHTPYTFDRDGDGDADLYLAGNVWSGQGGGASVDVIYDNVGGTFVPAGTVSGTGQTSAVESADFDGDGDPDLLVSRYGVNWWFAGATNPMVYVANLGASGFAAPIPIGGNHLTWDIDLGDFDGNGLVDAFQTNLDVWGLGTPDPCVVYLNQGGVGYTAVVQTGLSGYFTAAGDLNADGLTDLVIDTQVWFSTGAGGFVPGTALPSSLWAPASLADVDGDGDLDLVEAPCTVMLNLGNAVNAVFGAPVSYLPRVQGTVVTQHGHAVLDLDQDGDRDVLAQGPIVVSNTTRQIALGSIPRPGRPASVDLYGAPNGIWSLWVSSGTTSFSLPPWGTVLIDPAFAQQAAFGTFAGPAAPLPGTAALAVAVPPIPALVGWTTYWQSIDLASTRFTNRIAVTVMGF